MGDLAVKGVEDFELVMQGRANDVHPVAKYRSKSTGLEVVHADIEGPIVNGYIVLATKAEDDDGLPHTLEHLIFMGSEEYPYKGVLDVLANKCFASGTNAWTDVDHTAYTMTTAGSEGFINLLDIYMDHVFHPTLTDSAFTTEVYHTTGEGTDAGVVYCEMQATENSAEDKLHSTLVKTIYPPTSGYHYSYGGVCKNLRESCSNSKVRDFHKKFYNPKNACLVVCGKVSPEQIFGALEPTINKLIKKGVVSEWKKPWLDDVPEIDAPIEKRIQFPADEEDEEGIVMVGFRGPSAISEIEIVAAMRLLFEYLTDSSVGAMQLAFVENDDPICCDVSYAEMENSRTTFYVEFEGVPPDKSKKVVPTLKSTLEKQITKFDMTRMMDIIKKNYQEELSAMENTPHKSIAYAIIGDFLYGSDDKGKFEERINPSKRIKGFLDKPKEYWTSLIKENILKQKWITIYANPSKEAAEQLEKEESGRVQDRRSRLGEPGLAKMTYDLQEAIKTNSVPAPEKILESIKSPCADSINFHSITRHKNPDWASGLNCNFFLDDMKSNFVYVSVHMDTTALTYEQKKYLPLFEELLLESPVLRGETLMSFEDVVADLNRTWLSYGCSMGIDGGGRFKCGSYSHIFAFNCQMELSKLEHGFDWLQWIIWKTQWKAERAKVVAAKMAGDIPQLKRKGSRMVYSLLKDLLYKNNSNVKTSSLIRQFKFLKEIPSLSEKKLTKMLDSIRDTLTTPSNFSIHIAASLEKLNAQVKETRFGDVNNLLSSTFPLKEDKTKRLSNNPDMTWMRDPSSFVKAPELRILGSRNEEASYLVKVAPGPSSYMDPEWPLVLTAIQYLCQTEGPFYSGIRGAGLAYDVYLDARCNEGLIYFSLYRCLDPVAAFTVAKEIVCQHLDANEWKEEFLTSAKSSLIYEFIEGQKTPLALSSSSLCSYYRGVPETYTRDIIAKILTIKIQDLQPIYEKYLKPLFTEDFVCSLVVPQDKVVPLIESFQKAQNKKFEAITGLANSFMEKWGEEDPAS